MYGGEIISADSRQVVKTMDIGTGKTPLTSGESGSKVEITKDFWRIDNIKIHGYDLIEPNEDFSAWHFVQYARNKIKDISEKDIVPLLVGGTGFYIDATLGTVKLSSKTTSLELREKLNKMKLEELTNYFNRLDITKKVDMKNRVRIQRAIENNLNIENTENLPELNSKTRLKIGLIAERTFLYSRVDKWVETMWQNGLIEETKMLLEKYGEQNSKLQGVVYKTTLAYLKGNLSAEEAIQRTKFDLHAYIRRQQTWFKKGQDISWFDISDNDYPNKIIDHVRNYLKC